MIGLGNNDAILDMDFAKRKPTSNHPMQEDVLFMFNTCDLDLLWNQMLDS